MNKKMCKILSAVMTISVVSFSFSVFADTDFVKSINSYNISTEKDLIMLSKKCKNDDWSLGKTVNITDDIVIKSRDFEPIPIFRGTINGNGHTISGFEYDGYGSNKGFIRYLENSGKVKNLCVRGKVAPKGTGKNIGGIVGNNSGTVSDCMFVGDVSANSSVGGIVGVNKENGKLIGCTYNGNVSGEQEVAGIAGKNIGVIIGCKNKGNINTVPDDSKSDFGNAGTDFGEKLNNLKKSESEETVVPGKSDVGGISGLSLGIIEDCQNDGVIGYAHTGYNVGGIVGRQSGYVANCVNNQKVSGRKDVGGIIGQNEPDITLTENKDRLNQIRNELKNLKKDTDGLIDRASDVGGEISTYLVNISKNASDAIDNTKIVVDEVTKLVDDNIDYIDEKTLTISEILGNISKVTDSLDSFNDNMDKGFEQMNKGLGIIEDSAYDMNRIIKRLNNAIDKLKQLQRDIEAKKKELAEKINELKSAVSTDSDEQLKIKLKEISKILKKIKDNKDEQIKNINEINELLKEAPENLKEAINADSVSHSLSKVSKSLASNSSILNDLYNKLEKLTYSFKDSNDLLKIINDLKDALNNMINAKSEISDAMGDIAEAIKDSLDWASDLPKTVKRAIMQIETAVSSLKYGIDDITDGAKELLKITDDLSKELNINLVKPGEKGKTAGNNLYYNMVNISDSIEEIRVKLEGERENLTIDLHNISGRVDSIFNLLISELEDIKNAASKTTDDLYKDISDSSVSSTVNGKIKGCKNNGKIEGDKCVGGIVGAMSVDFAKDPEDDLKLPQNFNFTYFARASVDKCENNGNIVSKKENVGGICGKQSVGFVGNCENYGNVISESGNYAGGISGYSKSTVKGNYSKGKIEAMSGAGGISGYGERVFGSYSICEVKSDEYKGAIIGESTENALVTDNYYVDNGVGGIDDIGYSKRAEAISFEKMKSFSNIPERFISFKLSFCIDDRVIEEKNAEYGEVIDKITFPKIPEKEGKYGKWIMPEETKVINDVIINGEYYPYITSLASEEKADDNKSPLCIVKGKFDDESKVFAEKSKTAPPEIKKLGKKSVLDITIDDNTMLNNKYKIRIANKDRVRVNLYIYKNGKWDEAVVSVKGSYFEFETKNKKETVCVVYGLEKDNILWLILSSLIIFILSFVLLFALKRKKSSENLTK